jgi:1-aminocyclopropane-1-carboxylate deaminase/D-cysteine desulfhydrase-like pyridoxal-dependent ACC family enzyme
MTLSDLFLPHTPYETYTLQGVPVDIKREDLYCHSSIAPLAKMRGVNTVMNRLKQQGISTVGVYDFKVSRAGIGISAMAKYLEMKCYACYPHYKTYDTEGLPKQQLKCQEWGAELYPIRAAQIQVNFNMAKKFITEQGGYMFPKGIILDETLESVASEVDHDAKRLAQYSNIVLCNGSGTITTGLLLGLARNGLEPRVYSISCTTTTAHCKRLRQHLRDIRNPFYDYGYDYQKVKVIPADIEYYTDCEVEVPFPCHPNYDRKAWKWLGENILSLEGRVLFWNIGA